MQYHRPTNVSEVNELLKTFGNSAQILAGGTDILVEERYRSTYKKEYRIDISGIPDLKQIHESGDWIYVGPIVTHSEIIRSRLINEQAPLLLKACHVIGSLQIRNRGTIGGNICNASPCADSIPALMALDARLVIDSSAGEHILPISEFFLKPYQTILKPGQWLKEIRIKKMVYGENSSFIKLGRRNAVAISRMNFAVIMKTTNKNIIEYLRFVPGSVFPVWRRVTEAEEYLKGNRISKELFEKAGAIVSGIMIQNSGRRWSTPYKEPVVAALTARVLSQAAGLVE